jgi:hypothetical protein
MRAGPWAGPAVAAAWRVDPHRHRRGRRFLLFGQFQPTLCDVNQNSALASGSYGARDLQALLCEAPIIFRLGPTRLSLQKSRSARDPILLIAASWEYEVVNVLAWQFLRIPCLLADLIMQFATYFWRSRQCHLNLMPFASSLQAAVARSDNAGN